jgi:hypothetical protein
MRPTAQFHAAAHHAKGRQRHGKYNPDVERPYGIGRLCSEVNRPRMSGRQPRPRSSSGASSAAPGLPTIPSGRCHTDFDDRASKTGSCFDNGRKEDAILVLGEVINEGSVTRRQRLRGIEHVARSRSTIGPCLPGSCACCSDITYSPPADCAGAISVFHIPADPRYVASQIGSLGESFDTVLPASEGYVFSHHRGLVPGPRQSPNAVR